MTEAVAWLLIEGPVPLFGAGVVYLAMGLCVLVVEKQRGRPFNYPWRESRCHWALPRLAAPSW